MQFKFIEGIKFYIAFTLAEVIIVMGVIGIVAEVTIPTLVQKQQEQQMVTGLLKFNSELQSSINMWKIERNCYSSTYDCLVSQSMTSSGGEQDMENFLGSVGKSFKAIQKVATDKADVDWLPSGTANYYGVLPSAGSSGQVSNGTTGMGGFFLLPDGMTVGEFGCGDFSCFEVWVDVNGKKQPNRLGKDTFRMVVGSDAAGGKDIIYCAYNGVGNSQGLCDCWSACNPNNPNPSVSNGAMITSYVLLNKKLPDFTSLSKTVAGFKP